MRRRLGDHHGRYLNFRLGNIRLRCFSHIWKQRNLSWNLMGPLGTLFLHLCQMSAWRSIENLIIYIFLLTCLWRSRWQLDRKCSYSCLRRATLVYASWEFLHWQHTPVQRKEMTTIPRKRRSFVLSSTSLNAGWSLVFLALSHLTWIMAQGNVLNWKFIDNSVEVILGENEAHWRF